MRSQLVFSLSVLGLACLGEPTFANPPTAAPAAGSTLHIGTVDVKGMQHLVETLQEIKVAIKRPFGNDPAHFDDMVCSLVVSHGLGALDCGTQGWFSMRRDQYLFGNAWSGDAPAISTLGHPWHVVRTLNMKQVQALRFALKEVPAAGEGKVQVIDDSAQAEAASAKN